MSADNHIPKMRVSVVRETSAEYKPYQVTSSAVAVNLLSSMMPDDDEREHMVMLILDTRNIVKSRHEIAVGTLSGCLVGMREVFRPAIVDGASGIVLAHNHPSGSTIPSNEDRALAKRAKEAGDLLGIRVLDFLVKGLGADYFSFADAGLLQVEGS